MRNPPRAANHVVSRALTTQSDHHGSDSAAVKLSEEDDVELLYQSIQHGSSPSPQNLSELVSLCAIMASLDMGVQTHAAIFKSGFCSNVYICSALVDIYGKCGTMTDAQKADCPQMAIGFFQKMLKEGLVPTLFSLSGALVGCSQLGAQKLGTQVHYNGFEFNGYVAVTLVTTYSRCNSSLEDFDKLCSCVTIWDNISWNAVIAGFSNLGIGKQALKCFSEMRKTGVNVDLFTLASVLRAISTMSALKEGNQIHAHVCKTLHGSNLYIQNGLVSMYARCGAIDDSRGLLP
ncbi:Pentatricopeptide repeat [Trema orientale]|uniref:Pentatricopeptide repeat n=1 Tax=Trema orientale TaxID=63057 RepID=A0A2P5D6B9_TREOI|nr:Pentatricopeptide repeat [Trema orientale]